MSISYSTTGFGIALILSTAALLSAPAKAEHVLYAFQGGADGAVPFSSLLSDAAGNLYGTTDVGGAGVNCPDGSQAGCGTVFRLAPDGTETVLYAFQGGVDGAIPDDSGLIVDDAGNFYGTTAEGGSAGDGTIFELAAGGTETVLHTFLGGNDGEEPIGRLLRDHKGDLYGVTGLGGGAPACGDAGCGTAFKLKPNGTEVILHAFQGGSDGAGPTSGLIADAAGNLYGTAAGGGAQTCTSGCGVVFKLVAGGTETIVYDFQGGSDGIAPFGALTSDKNGDFYGTTFGGGVYGQGTVFKLTSAGVETVLYSFKGENDGARPEAGVIIDKSGNLYGTTYFGGGTGCAKTGHTGCGTVFKLAPDGTETVLYAFKKSHGAYPGAPLLLKHGQLYGTASAGDIDNNGVVFSVKP